MRDRVSDFRTIIFDCDGVILNSNQVKTSAFREVASVYGDDAAKALVQFHVLNGGVSRYEKFRFFLDEIVSERKGQGLEVLIRNFSEKVRSGLMQCEVAPDLEKLRECTANARWMIVSGGDQAELRSVFQERGLSDMFDGGIFGSPENKDEILSELKRQRRLVAPILFLGDSAYDYEAAVNASIDFIFVSGWSELTDWPSFVKRHNLDEVNSIGNLIQTQLDELPGLATYKCR